MTRARATIGVFLAGGALLGSLAIWSGGRGSLILSTLALVLLLTFSVGRHDRLSARLLVAIPIIGGAAIAGMGGYLFLLEAPGSLPRIVTGIVGVLGIGCIGIGLAEYRNIPVDSFAEGSHVLLIGAAVGFGGFLLAGIAGCLPGLMLEGLGVELSAVIAFALSQSGVAVGFVLATWLFFIWTGDGWAFLDLRIPTRRDLGYMLGGTIIVVALAALVQLILIEFGAEFATHQVEQRAREEGAAILIVAIIFSFVTNGLGEELLYRNGIQKYLGTWFTPITAIVVSSLIFSLIHFPAYGDIDPLATLGSITVVFTLSLILGAAYYRTENVLVPVVIHGSYNALVWVLLYIQIFG